MTAGKPDEARTDDMNGVGSAHTTTEATVDDVFSALAHRRRRTVLQQLRTLDDGETTLQRLVERMDADEESTSLAVSLHHVHLPKLDAMGIVSYSPDRRRVRYLTAPTVEDVLDALDD
jgi:DNA-binding transcriptional ArsR family regulator